jgi:hypothetical protein
MNTRNNAQACALCTIAYISAYTTPCIAWLGIRCKYPVPNRERSAGALVSDFASVLGSAKLLVLFNWEQNLATKRNCPQRRGVGTSRSHRCGTVERYLLAVIGVRPFRCLNCDVRFHAFAHFDEETSVNNEAARAVFSEESDMIENNWLLLYRAAVFEINRSKLLDRVKAAEDAIRARASLGGQVSSDERISIQDAMAALLVMRRDLAQSPVAKIKQHQDA